MKDMSYPGQKNIDGVKHKIINEIPFCKRFVEPFAGSGAIGKIIAEKSPGTKVIFNDKNPSLEIEGFKVKHFDFNVFFLFEPDISSKDNFYFVDPPYLHETRSNKKLYGEYELTNEDHKNILSFLTQSVHSPVMIVHPICDLYEKHLHDWRKVPVNIRYNNKTSKECLYMNYPKPKNLLITDYLGKNNIDRQRIKRKSDRLLAKIERLPELERQYILTDIVKTFLVH